MCQWYAFCVNDPVGVVNHPILGDVPTCQRCADKHDLAMLPFPEEEMKYVWVDDSPPDCIDPDAYDIEIVSVQGSTTYLRWKPDRALAENVYPEPVVDPELLARGAALAQELGLDTGS